MIPLFIDYKSDGAWQKQWKTLYSNPIIEEWSDELDQSVRLGKVVRDSRQVVLIVVHEKVLNDIWIKLIRATEASMRQSGSGIFQLKVTGGTSHNETVSSDGWVCLSGRKVNSREDLSSMSGPFSNLLLSLQSAFSSKHPFTRMEAWKPWLMGKSWITDSGELLAMAILARLAGLWGEGKIPHCLDIESIVGSREWWRRGLGKASIEGMKTDIDRMIGRLGQKHDEIERIATLPMARKLEIQATIKALIKLLRDILDDQLRLSDSFLAAEAFRRDCKWIVML